MASKLSRLSCARSPSDSAEMRELPCLLLGGLALFEDAALDTPAAGGLDARPAVARMPPALAMDACCCASGVSSGDIGPALTADIIAAVDGEPGVTACGDGLYGEGIANGVAYGEGECEASRLGRLTLPLPPPSSEA